MASLNATARRHESGRSDKSSAEGLHHWGFSLGVYWGFSWDAFVNKYSSEY